MNESPHAGRDLVVGLFLLVAIAGVVAIATRAVSWERSDDLRLYAMLDRSHGLREGSPVRVADLVVGQVTAVRLVAQGPDRGRIRVEFFVRGEMEGERVADLFPAQGQPARARVEGSLLAGGEGSLSVDTGALPASGEGPRRIDAEESSGIEDQTRGLVAQLKKTMGEMDGVLCALRDAARGLAGDGEGGASACERIARTTASLERIVGDPDASGDGASLASAVRRANEVIAKIADPASGTVGEVVATHKLSDALAERVDRVILDTKNALAEHDRRVADLLAAATAIAEAAKRQGVVAAVTGSASARESLEATIAALERASRQIEAAAIRLPRAADEGAAMFAQGRRTAAAAGDVVDATRRHWLFQGLFEPPDDPWLRVYDVGDAAAPAPSGEENRLRETGGAR